MQRAPARRTEPMAPSYRYTPGARTDRQEARPAVPQTGQQIAAGEDP
jgi:hypothetical protein